MILLCCTQRTAHPRKTRHIATHTDEHYKVRAYNPDSRTHRATFLGPTHGGPIVRLLPFRSVASGGCLCACACVCGGVCLRVCPEGLHTIVRLLPFRW